MPPDGRPTLLPVGRLLPVRAPALLLRCQAWSPLWDSSSEGVPLDREGVWCRVPSPPSLKDTSDPYLREEARSLSPVLGATTLLRIEDTKDAFVERSLSKPVPGLLFLSVTPDVCVVREKRSLSRPSCPPSPALMPSPSAPESLCRRPAPSLPPCSSCSPSPSASPSSPMRSCWTMSAIARTGIVWHLRMESLMASLRSCFEGAFMDV
mmetsp:Transcript_4287/g.11651  ORF Transcript_4287/g.11651 Transcript_4287/m.11651 type:complete len:208 (+) Transcript_4287:1758-2381(+)